MVTVAVSLLCPDVTYEYRLVSDANWLSAMGCLEAT